MTVDFEMHAGDDKTLEVTVLDQNGVAVDISSSTIRWRASRSKTKTADIIKKTGGAGISLSDPTNGVFTVTLDAADTESLTGIFYHEGQLTLPNGTLSTVLSGKMTVLMALIRSTAS